MNEDEWEYNGPLSTYKEIHSAAIGFVAGYIDNRKFKIFVIMYTILGGVIKHRRVSGHWKDVAKEPAYALGMMVLGSIVKSIKLELTGTNR